MWDEKIQEAQEWDHILQFFPLLDEGKESLASQNFETSTDKGSRAS